MAKGKRERRSTIRNADVGGGIDEDLWAAAERDLARKPDAPEPEAPDERPEQPREDEPDS